MIAITNCKFFTGSGLEINQSVFIKDNKIEKISGDDVPDGYDVVDAKGAWLSSGLIDLQIYGSGGNLFSAYPSAETLAQMDLDLIGKGTTSFLACVATNSMEIVYQAMDAAKKYKPDAKGFLGLHLEGPYLNPKRLGAHVPEFIRTATLDEVKAILDYAEGTVRMMTIAAELQSDEVIAYLLEQGIVLSLGHSDASFGQATAAYNKGVTTTTHLFNAMPSIHHRAPNLPAAVLNHPSARASIIADGVHVDFEVLKMAHKLMQERLFLITDAVTSCHIGPYKHQLQGNRFVTPEGTLSGSNITLLDAVRNCVEYCGISLKNALNMASLYPSEVIGISEFFGEIAVGKNADLILLDDKFVLQKVFIGGVAQMMIDN